MEIVILLYKGFTAMDVVSAYEILCRLPDAKVKFAAKEKGVIESEYPSMKMVATHNLGEIVSADILLVPGSTFAFMQVAQDIEILHHIKRIDATTGWTTSVCTGAIILGAAGLLQGKKATTHWAMLDRLTLLGAQPKSERFVKDGKIVTAAGVSAGTDMALFLSGLIADEEYARMLQLVVEYYPEPPFDIPELTGVPKNIETAARKFLKREIDRMNMQTAV
jgi:transcriptional regulator GlxA family with amidase domain